MRRIPILDIRVIHFPTANEIILDYTSHGAIFIVCFERENDHSVTEGTFSPAGDHFSGVGCVSVAAHAGLN